ncbi:hypothetical protein EB796_018684 [Bugula neritina]|uniref:Uncharacterized protein n=1 Tax=Bugula neritina TaxID=10212 RepID=A0A7J7J9T4_BUGNE|nr:hypothetical protein EB796_018684 [Bugula neritina]
MAVGVFGMLTRRAINEPTLEKEPRGTNREAAGDAPSSIDISLRIYCPHHIALIVNIHRTEVTSTSLQKSNGCALWDTSVVLKGSF